MNQNIDVIYEDNHLLVLNKPALLPTMGVMSGKDSLVTLSKNYIKQKYSKPGNVFLGVVSRLDSFVSGVIVLARTSKAAARLNQQFSSGAAQKKYLAIVPSKNCQTNHELVDWVIKDEAKHRMMTVSKEINGSKEARLSYRCLGEFDHQCLVEIELHTGRKHQIRVQMSARGRPIIGDRKYGSKLPFKQGIALHSLQLTIQHPTSKDRLQFRKEPPAWWRVARFTKGADRNKFDD